MDITQLPFNKLIELSISDNENYLYMLKDNNKYTNHIQTVHAAALFSLAEASSAQLLIMSFPEYNQEIIPIVRNAEIKFKKSAKGSIYSKAHFSNINIDQIRSTLQLRNRVSFKTASELYDTGGNLVMSCQFEWFVTKQTLNSTPAK